MSDTNKQDSLEQDIFSYRVNKENKVTVYWHNKPVKMLKGRKAEKFLESMLSADGRESQLLMAKVTGNFKRGNEKLCKQ